MKKKSVETTVTLHEVPLKLETCALTYQPGRPPVPGEDISIELKLCVGNEEGIITTSAWISNVLRNMLRIPKEACSTDWGSISDVWQQTSRERPFLNYWIWIPSYKHDTTAILDYSQTLGAVDYVQVVVVRDEEFAAYKKAWATEHNRIILQLPSSLPFTPGIDPVKGSVQNQYINNSSTDVSNSFLYLFLI